MARCEFLSDSWLTLLERTAQQFLDKESGAPEKPVSYVEIFSDLPTHLEVGAGYVLAFADGKATVLRAKNEDEPADCRVRIDYGVALATLQVKAGPELDAMIKKAFADGQMTMGGSPEHLPIVMNDLHDILVEQTATPSSGA